MKKRILSVILALALTIGTCSITVAADRGGATRNSLKSYGSIEYHKGNDKVIINSEDLYMLADQIDQVKLEVADQLEAMNTYFTAGDGISLDTDRYISVTHTRPSRADFVDPVSVNFDTLLEGIAASQSVSSDVADYGYSPGTKLYKGANGELTTNGSEEGAEQISVSAATADNLSAGTVAWVNGRLILGTGGDNKAYFDSGCQSRPNEDDESGDVNKARYLDMKNGSSTVYTVQEDMVDVFLYFIGDVSPTIDSGEACTQVYKRVSTGFISQIYYLPKISKGTTIANIGKATTAGLITMKNSKKNGKASCIKGNGNYVIQEDMTDALLVTWRDKSSLPKFTPPNDQPYVSYKLLNDKNYSCIYYVPKIPAYTSIEVPYGFHMVY